MNKTITSNIAGYVFHIDENAFEKLDAYLNTIRSYFNDSQGRDEIITDIEARLAEMLQERIGDMKQVVSLQDVNHVISIMGQPEAFLEDDPDTAEWAEQKSSSRGSGPKRLFRDTDDRVGAGICSGISHYLGLHDPIWLRLAFVLSLFLSFGTALIVYIILYLIIPEARTTGEKLQMRGESVTVSNIEKRVNEELESVKNKWNDLHGNSGAGRKMGDAFHRAITLVGSLAIMLLKFFGKIIGFIFLMAGILGFLGLMSVPFGVPAIISISNNGILSSVEAQDILNNLVGGTGMIIWIYIAGILVYGIPLLALAYIGLRLLVNFRSRPKGIGLSMIALWIIGVVMSFALTMIIVSDFSSEGSDTQTVELNLNADTEKVIHLGLNHELGDDEPNIEATIFNLDLLAAGNSNKLYGKPELDVNLAKTGGPKLVIKRMARAKKKQEALERSSKIDYGFLATDTSILFNGYFEIPEDELWRTQDVELELLLPVGYTIYLSDEMMRIIYDIDNTTNTYDGDMVGRRWIMTPKGLACVDCEGLETSKNQSNVDVDIDIDDMNIRIKMKDKQRDLELEKKRLEREMEEHQKELDRIQKELKNEGEKVNDESEEASARPQEILLKRVINASYWVTPTIHRTVSVSYPI
ncbi:MAG: PspC domain-containing protein [Flavobacteriales bacterium]|nr:PspC domain-containing protein [Flavobacteriales bacterium]